MDEKEQTSQINATVAEDIENNSMATSQLDQTNKANAAQWYQLRRSKILLIFAAVLVVILITVVPVVSTISTGSTSAPVGPQFRRTATFLRECSASLCSLRAQMTANGNRLFISNHTRFSREHNDVFIEVVDLQKNGEWVTTSRVQFNDGNVTSKVLSWKISGDGRRIIVTSRPYGRQSTETVRVLEEDPAQTEWRQVGEPFTSDSLLELGLSAPFYQCPNDAIRMNAYPSSFGDFQVAISNDGNIIALSSYRSNTQNFYHGCNSTNETIYAESSNARGVVHAFRLLANASADDHTKVSAWVPYGNLLLGRFPDAKFGQRIALSGSGKRLAVGASMFGEGLLGKVFVFDMNDSKEQWNTVAEDTVSSTRSGTDVIAMGRNGQVVTISEADALPSAYSEKPYRGMVGIFFENMTNDDDQYTVTEAAPLVGNVAFQHLGSHVAVASDDAKTIVVASVSSYSSKFPDGNRIEVFRKNSSINEWELGPPVSTESFPSTESLGVSDDGKRIVVIQQRRSNEFEVSVYDLLDS